jgi:hypothetical protein
VQRNLTPLERFWSKVDKSGNCWRWTGHVDAATGYGHLSWNGKSIGAHRASYEIHFGPIPAGLEIDHVRARGCTSRACVNPAHLEAVTRQQNQLRGATIAAASAAKTHCPQGHPYDETNTAITRRGHRRCRSCNREYNREYKQRHRARQRPPSCSRTRP